MEDDQLLQLLIHTPFLPLDWCNHFFKHLDAAIQILNLNMFLRLDNHRFQVKALRHVNRVSAVDIRTGSKVKLNQDVLRHYRHSFALYSGRIESIASQQIERVQQQLKFDLQCARLHFFESHSTQSTEYYESLRKAFRDNVCHIQAGVHNELQWSMAGELFTKTVYDGSLWQCPFCCESNCDQSFNCTGCGPRYKQMVGLS